jgi:predicted SprT family Zn-dependent metalloprotease
MMDTEYAEKIVVRLANEYGISDPWNLAWHYEVRNDLGRTDFIDRLVILNHPMLMANDEVILREVANHEFAHVMVGPFADHGPQWQRVARALGCTLTVETGMMPEGVLTHPEGYTPVCPRCADRRVSA